MFDGFELKVGCLHGITTDNASWDYFLTLELHSTFEQSGILWPAFRNLIPYMAYGIKLALEAFMSSLGANRPTKFSEDNEGDLQFGANGTLDFGISDRIPKEINGRISQVSAMRPGEVMLIEKVRMSTYFESPETDIHFEVNVCYIDYTDTWSSKQDR